MSDTISFKALSGAYGIELIPDWKDKLNRFGGWGILIGFLSDVFDIKSDAHKPRVYLCKVDATNIIDYPESYLFYIRGEVQSCVYMMPSNTHFHEIITIIKYTGDQYPIRLINKLDWYVLNHTGIVTSVDLENKRILLK